MLRIVRQTKQVAAQARSLAILIVELAQVEDEAPRRRDEQGRRLAPAAACSSSTRSACCWGRLWQG